MIGDNDVHTYGCRHKLSSIMDENFVLGWLYYWTVTSLRPEMFFLAFLYVTWNSMVMECSLAAGSVFVFIAVQSFARAVEPMIKNFLSSETALVLKCLFCNLVCTCLHAIQDFTLAVEPTMKDHPDETHTFFFRDLIFWILFPLCLKLTEIDSLAKDHTHYLRPLLLWYLDCLERGVCCSWILKVWWFSVGRVTKVFFFFLFCCCRLVERTICDTIMERLFGGDLASARGQLCRGGVVTRIGMFSSSYHLVLFLLKE